MTEILCRPLLCQNFIFVLTARIDFLIIPLFGTVIRPSPFSRIFSCLACVSVTAAVRLFMKKMKLSVARWRKITLVRSAISKYYPRLGLITDSRPITFYVFLLTEYTCERGREEGSSFCYRPKQILSMEEGITLIVITHRFFFSSTRRCNDSRTKEITLKSSCLNSQTTYSNSSWFFVNSPSEAVSVLKNLNLRIFKKTQNSFWRGVSLVRYVREASA